MPIFPENEPEKCENPEELETVSVFKQGDIAIERSTDETTLPRTVTNYITQK